MSQMISTVPSIVARHPGSATGVTEKVVGFARRVAAEWQVRQAALAIEQLDDRSLADIGLGHGQAESAARYGRSRLATAAMRPAEAVRLMPMSFSEWR